MPRDEKCVALPGKLLYEKKTLGFSHYSQGADPHIHDSIIDSRSLFLHCKPDNVQTCRTLSHIVSHTVSHTSR